MQLKRQERDTRSKVVENEGLAGTIADREEEGEQ